MFQNALKLWHLFLALHLKSMHVGSAFQAVRSQYFWKIFLLRLLHYVHIVRKSVADKIIRREPAEFLCSCKRIPSQKEIQRGPKSPCVLLKMMQKFETNRNWTFQYLLSSVSVSDVSCVLAMPYFIKQKVLRHILLQDGNSKVRNTFALKFFAGMVIIASWPWNILRTEEAYFRLNRQVITHNRRIQTRENSHAI